MVLSLEQLARMSRLLDEAIDLDEAGRKKWLEALSPENQDLKEELRRGLLDPPKLDIGVPLSQRPLPPHLPSDAADLKVGDRVGPYLLIRELGHGGMALVWVAQRADGAFKREVALKLPMLSRLRKDLASRFARERDILAALEHPNIARLYDAGVSTEGLPYLAMEYVHGEPLTGWCNSHRLSIRERLKLFLQVLDAVQYAHGHHVIHRDIKPSNILVTESGQVRLLDFGVAKLLSQEEEQTELTQLYGRALTPEYASPELVQGEPIDAAADVYSLGVVLYELLSGSRPYRLKAGASLALLEQAIATAEVERPSTQLGQDAGTDRSTTQNKLARCLKGDLDAILLKALAKAPADRYGSAEALADDLQRHLSGEPVEARPARLSYRFTKFVLRRRTAVTLAALLVLLVGALAYEVIRREASTGPPMPSAGSISRQNLTASGPAPVAASDKSTEQGVRSVIAQPPKTIAVLPFLDLSEKKDQEYFADGMAEEIIDVLAKIPHLKVIGRTSSFQFRAKHTDLREVGKALGAAYVLEGSVRRSQDRIRVSVQLIDARDGSHRWSESYDRPIGDVLKVQDDIAAGLVRTIQVQVGAADLPARVTVLNPEAYDLFLRARAARDRFDRQGQEDAIGYYQRALKVDPTFLPAAVGLAFASVNLFFYERTEAAASQARAAIDVARKLNPNLAEMRAARARLYIYHDLNWAVAEAEIQQGLRMDPENKSVQTVAGLLACVLGRWDEAMRYFRAALSHDPFNVAAILQSAACLVRAGHYVEAEEQARHGLAISSTSDAMWVDLGRALLARGQFSDALDAFRHTNLRHRRLVGLTAVYSAMGRRAESDQAMRQLEAAAATEDPYEVAEGRAYRGELKEALKWLERAGAQKDPDISRAKGDPAFARYAGDLRYRAWLRKMNLPD